MGSMNVFRVLGDISHTTSKCILIWAIHANKSAEGGQAWTIIHCWLWLILSATIGVSLITQALYAVVFCSRYVDLFWTMPTTNLWNFVLKNFYIFSSLYIIFVMMRLYARTREREKAWKLGSICFGGALVAAPLVTLIFRKWAGTTFLEVWLPDPAMISAKSISRFYGPSRLSLSRSAFYPS
jgi:ER lumen protein retaining receptor